MTQTTALDELVAQAQELDMGYGADPTGMGGRLTITDHPPGVTPVRHLWLPYPVGGHGWRICKWCGLTQNSKEAAGVR